MSKRSQTFIYYVFYPDDRPSIKLLVCHLLLYSATAELVKGLAHLVQSILSCLLVAELIACPTGFSIQFTPV